VIVGGDVAMAKNIPQRAAACCCREPRVGNPLPPANRVPAGTSRRGDRRPAAGRCRRVPLWSAHGRQSAFSRKNSWRQRKRVDRNFPCESKGAGCQGTPICTTKQRHSVHQVPGGHRHRVRPHAAAFVPVRRLRIALITTVLSSLPAAAQTPEEAPTGTRVRLVVAGRAADFGCREPATRSGAEFRGWLFQGEGGIGRFTRRLCSTPEHH
jgi:hypothetical protein